jgi:hypothetical protein
MSKKYKIKFREKYGYSRIELAAKLDITIYQLGRLIDQNKLDDFIAEKKLK